MLMVEGAWTPTETYFLRSIVFVAVVWVVRLIQYYKFPASIKPIKDTPLRPWAALMVGGAVTIGIAGILFAVCIQSFPVSVVTPVTSASPFLTVILSRIFLKERLSKTQNVGISFVVIGSIIVSL
jgi:drug/metabolite transporter (DMT)-like permease